MTKILIVDDEESIRLLLEQILEQKEGLWDVHKIIKYYSSS